MNYAPRISLPYNDMSGVIQVWSRYCDKMAVYEHEADKKVSTTHIHLIMLGCTYKTPEALKRKFFNITNRTDLSGNSLWRWMPEDDDYQGEPDVSFIKYMSKGSLEPKFLKNISQEECDYWKAKWEQFTAPSKQTLLQTKDPKKLTKYDICQHVFNRIKEQNPGIATENIPDELWFRSIRKVLIEHRQPLGLYKVVDIYDACIMYHDKSKFLTNCLQILEKRKPRV